MYAHAVLDHRAADVRGVGRSRPTCTHVGERLTTCALEKRASGESLSAVYHGSTAPTCSDQERRVFRKNGVTRFGQKRQPLRRKALPVSGRGAGRSDRRAPPHDTRQWADGPTQRSTIAYRRGLSMERRGDPHHLCHAENPCFRVEPNRAAVAWASSTDFCGKKWRGIMATTTRRTPGSIPSGCATGSASGGRPTPRG